MLETLVIVVPLVVVIAAGAMLISSCINEAGSLISTAIKLHADRVEASARRLEETIYSEVARISQKL